jgi:hypothetical protein
MDTTSNAAEVTLGGNPEASNAAEDRCMNKQEIRTDIAARLRDGRQLLRKEHLEAEVTKRGNLRAGNSGIMSEDGSIAGSCARLAHLRQLGIELEPPDDSLLIMFQVGNANEDLIDHDLKQTAVPGELIRREEEIPISWRTANGTLVTGRPDIVLGSEVICADERTGSSKQFKPELLLELKSVASVWTTRSVLVDREPKLAHLIQAAHYMWQLGGIPGRLIYKQYSIQEIPAWEETKDGAKRAGWGRRLFEKADADARKYIDMEKGRVRPYEIVYDLLITEDGTLKYKQEEHDTTWTDTIISIPDIERFYEFVSEMGPQKKLGQLPVTVGTTGAEKRYTNCSYCPLNATCQSVKKVKGAVQYTTWVDAVHKFLATKVLTSLPE